MYSSYTSLGFKRYLVSLLVFLVLTLTSCGGGGGGASVDADPVGTSLKSLGVDISDKPLKDDSGATLPDSYTPLGAIPKVNTQYEIMIVGATAKGSPYAPPTTINTLATTGNDPTTATKVELDSWTNGDPWNGTDWIRAGASADLNGDGLDEELIIYKRKANVPNPSINPVELKVLENTDPNKEGKAFTIDNPIFISNNDPTFLDIVTGDFDGNGKLDAAVVLMEATQIKIIFLQNTDGVLALSGKELVIPAQDPAVAELQAVVKVGNLDYDAAQELAVVVNEYHGSANTANNSSHYYLFDDALANFAPLPVNKAGDTMGSIQSTISGSQKIVALGNVALADLDGDGLDEIILGGIEQNGGDYNDLTGTIKYIVYVLDDVPNEMTELAHVEQLHSPVTGTSAGTTNTINYLQINAVDLDGDGAKEIQANEFVFDNLLNTTPPGAGSTEPPTLIVRNSITKSVFMFNPADGANETHVFNWRTNCMIAANVLHLNDGRQQIVMHSESVDSQRVRVIGLNNVGTFTTLYTFVADSFTGGSSAYPKDSSFKRRSLQLAPTNVNNDTLVLKYVSGSHTFAYTEPIVIAALAAAPCWSNKGQDTGNCTTAYGIGSSVSATNENTVTVHGSLSFGGKIQSLVGGAKSDLKAELTYAHTWGKSGTLSKSITYTSGGLQDSVVFTSVPVDLYDYEVVTYPAYRDLEGTVIQLRAPRQPVTRMVTRNYYNDHIKLGAMKIDSTIFSHTPGDPMSYMGSTAKDNLVNQASLVPNPLGLADKKTGNDSLFESDPVTVGEGNGGTTSAVVDLSTETSVGNSIGLDVTFEAEMNGGGVMAGWSVGAGVDHSLTISHGTNVTYTGTVSQMTTPSFPSAAYNYGIFSYYRNDTQNNRQFEVVNYWVDPL